MSTPVTQPHRIPRNPDRAVHRAVCVVSLLTSMVFGLPGCEEETFEDVRTGAAWHDSGEWLLESARENYPPFECPGEHSEDIYGFDSYSVPHGAVWHKVTDQAWDATTDDADEAEAWRICEASYFEAERKTFLENEEATSECQSKTKPFHCEPKDGQGRACETSLSDTCEEPTMEDIVSACREDATVLKYRGKVVAGCKMDCSLFVNGDALIDCHTTSGG